MKTIALWAGPKKERTKSSYLLMHGEKSCSLKPKVQKFEAGDQWGDVLVDQAPRHPAI